MSKTVAVLVVRQAKQLALLGNMPIMSWSLAQLEEVRGISRIVCAVNRTLVAKVEAKLKGKNLEIVKIPKELEDESVKDSVFDQWLTAATGPAADADIVIVSKCSSPFLQSGKIESCLRHVKQNKCTHAQPSRQVTVTGVRKVTADESVESVRVFRVNVPIEQRKAKTVPVTMVESLDLTHSDHFVIADALILAKKI